MVKPEENILNYLHFTSGVRHIWLGCKLNPVPSFWERMSANESRLLFSVSHFLFQDRRVDVIFFKPCIPLIDRPKVKLHQSTVSMALPQTSTRSEMRVPSTFFSSSVAVSPLCLALPCLSHILSKDEHRPLCLKCLQQSIEDFCLKVSGDLFTFPIEMNITRYVHSPAIYWTFLLKRYCGSFYFFHWD